MKGTIVKFDSGRRFGFIRPTDKSDDIFFHSSDVEQGDISVGASVKYSVGQGDKGPKAIHVIISRPAVNPYSFFIGAVVFITSVATLSLRQFAPTLQFYQHVLISLNIAAFAAVGFDKGIAGSGSMRIPEKVLFGVAAIGGSLGLILGVNFFRHKTKKSSFQLVLGVIIALQLVAAFKLFPGALRH